MSGAVKCSLQRACFSCHRFNNEGGANGPDLTSAGHRYSPRDLLDQIINPSKEINEQFVPVQVTQLEGQTFYGIIVNLNKDTIRINTDLANPDQRIGLDRKGIKSIDPSPISPMPPGLLNLLEKEEIFDLVAYILSGGNPEDYAFQQLTPLNIYRLNVCPPAAQLSALRVKECLDGVVYRCRSYTVQRHLTL